MQWQQPKQRQSERDPSRFDLYERAKADYVGRFPDASPQQYQQAMTELARRYGV